MLLTIAYNVPLNNHLASLPADAPDAAAQWQSLARGWTIANHVRAAASLAAMACLILALLTGRSSPATEDLMEQMVRRREPKWHCSAIPSW